MPTGVARHVAFAADRMRTPDGELIMPKIRDALAFWDKCLGDAGRAFAETAI